MTITREQLELAAKAAGIPGLKWDEAGKEFNYPHEGLTGRGNRWFGVVVWNPLTDHGQLHDLAMACKICIDPHGNKITYLSDGESYASAKVVQVDCQDFPALAEEVILAAAEQQQAKEKKE